MCWTCNKECNYEIKNLIRRLQSNRSVHWEKHWELHEKGDYQNALELLQTKMVPLEEQMEEMDPYAVYPEWWPYEKQRGFSFMELRIRSLEKRERELGIERTNQ